MLTAERRQFILEILRHEGKVLSSELSTQLNVSEDTIRRDLREMADAGLLQRVHGGALLGSPVAINYTTRLQQFPTAKEAIARAAAKLIRPGQVAILDGGTTTLQVAQHLPLDLHATVVTHSPPIAVALAEHPHVEAIILGGRLHKSSIVTVGAATVEALRSIRADICMLGVCSVHPEVGISSPNLEEVYVKRTMIAGATEVVALVSAEKLGTASPYIVGSLSELTHLVTERTIPDNVLAPYQALGLTIVRG